MRVRRLLATASARVSVTKICAPTIPLGSAVGHVIVNLLPFLLLIGFWVRVMRRMRSGAGVPNSTVDKLEQIRQEPERIRTAVDGDSFRNK